MTALLGPVLLLLSIPVLAARPSPFVTAIALAIGVTVVAANARLLLGRQRARVPGLALAAIVPLFLTSHCAAPLPAVPLEAAWPASPPRPGVAAYRLPTAVIHRTAAFAYRGGSFFDRRDFAMTAVFVQHPQGDLLIDSGFGREIETQIATMMPLPFRLVTDIARGRTVVEQLEAAGYDLRRLRAILLTHAHWDHMSGAADLPDVPILITAPERRFVESGGWVTAFARSLPAARFIDYGFEDAPYLGFPKSHDLYGDGTIVVVPAPGHTPGSVIVFVAASNGRHLALIGDLAWQREGITAREERPWFMRQLADVDAADVRQGLSRMAAIAAGIPDLSVIPAHDGRAYDALPLLGDRVRELTR